VAYSHEPFGVTVALQVTTKVDRGGAGGGTGSNPVRVQLNALSSKCQHLTGVVDYRRYALRPHTVRA
jgi:hypothetical protein